MGEGRIMKRTALTVSFGVGIAVYGLTVIGEYFYLRRIFARPDASPGAATVGLSRDRGVLSEDVAALKTEIERSRDLMRIKDRRIAVLDKMAEGVARAVADQADALEWARGDDDAAGTAGEMENVVLAR